ncbi:nuclear transcription factor Y subunit B-3-like [Actinidia eriantha]|uniref:nuclear transcription factor Y subunit B-3-like n=1 Tax=Actinidia eriantha TaxID=165200 RepID=UPI00258729D2|nr:nuclear transcription factor Y subunit B-3-like [Actinidia eriantha]
MAGKKNLNSPIGSPSSDKVQDRFLPIANVSRIMKKSLPANAKISKEAKETVQTCVSEFISFITGEASEKCQREKRKTINGDDLMWAMTTLGFENYVGPLVVYLNKYRETEGDQKNSAKQEEDRSLARISSANSISTKSDLKSFNDENYVLGAQVASKSYVDHGRVIGYGESMVGGTFSMGKIHELGGDNGKRAMLTHLHPGIEW